MKRGAGDGGEGERQVAECMVRANRGPKCEPLWIFKYITDLEMTISEGRLTRSVTCRGVLL